MMLTIFSCAHLPFVYLLWWSICSGFLPICEWVVFLWLSFESSLYFLTTTLLSDVLQILTPSLCLVFLFSWQYLLKRQNFKFLMRSNLSVCSLMDLVVGVIWIHKWNLPNSKSERLSSMFSSWSFIVLGFTVRSIIHCGLIFVYGVRYGSKVFVFMFLNTDIHLLEDYLFSSQLP